MCPRVSRWNRRPSARRNVSIPSAAGYRSTTDAAPARSSTAISRGKCPAFSSTASSFSSPRSSAVITDSAPVTVMTTSAARRAWSRPGTANPSRLASSLATGSISTTATDAQALRKLAATPFPHAP